MKPETEFSLSVLLLAALAVPIHSVAMSLNRWPGIFISLLYVPVVVMAAWVTIWRCRAGLAARPPIGLLVALPLATAEVLIIGFGLGFVALAGTLGWELGGPRWHSIDGVFLPAVKYSCLAITAASLGLLLRACRSGRGLALLSYLALGVSGLLRHAEMRQVGQMIALGEEFPSRHGDWIAFLIPLAVGAVFISIGSRSPNEGRAIYELNRNA